MSGCYTNIQLRWSRAGGRYKHSAPLEPRGSATNIRLRWSRAGMKGRGCYKNFGSAGAARGNEERMLQTIGVSRTSDKTEGPAKESEWRTACNFLPWPINLAW